MTHLNVILGNHDLAYRSDYTTSALEALAIARLSPFVTLHTKIGYHEWDRRRVLVIPFREDQSQIIKFVRNLDRKSAAETVGFGHLAINRAITQKHMVNPETGKARSPSRYPGLTGALDFTPLTRTFTSHFHSHQTILQKADQQSKNAQGSITYIGAPLQLTWADLYDIEKGVLLLDPTTLEYEFVRNPHGVGYTTVGAREVLGDQVPVERVKGKHVMITGKLSTYKYISARERLIKLGVRSVRDWKPIGSQWQWGQRLLGQTVLPADVQDRSDHHGENVCEETGKTQPRETTRSSLFALPEPRAGKMKHEPLDLAEAVQEYVRSLDFDSTLEGKQDILTLVGKRLCDVGSYIHYKSDIIIRYKDMLNLSPLPSLISSSNTPYKAINQNIFTTHPILIKITNFLGIQGTLSLNFKIHFRPGMNFIIGHNGAGKSTIIKAIVWCQFGQCIRGGLGVNDVVNDVVRKNYNVRLTFANGYTISRFRKHSKFRNRVIVEKDGVVEPQFEEANLRSTQASINRLLGINFDTFIRTVQLGNKSAQSFLSSTSLQKRQLIKTVLGLGVLDGCVEVCNSMLSEVDKELEGKRSQLQEIMRSTKHLESQVNRKVQTLRHLREEAAYFENELRREQQKHDAALRGQELKLNELLRNLKTKPLSLDLKDGVLSLQKNISRAQSEVERLGSLARLAQARSYFDRERVIIKKEIMVTRTRLQNLGRDIKHLLEENDALDAPASVIEDNEAKKYNEASGKHGFLLKIRRSFERLWTFIRLTVKGNSKTERGVASRAIEVRQRWNQHVGAVATLAHSIIETQGNVMTIMHSIEDLPRHIAYQAGVNESDIHLTLRKLRAQEASMVPSQLTAAIDKLSILTNQHARLQREYKIQKQTQLRKQQNIEEHKKEIDMAKKAWTTSLNRYELIRVSGKQKIATYEELHEADKNLLSNFRGRAVDLSQEIARIHSHHDVFAFWRSAFTRRQVAAPKVTFRQHVTERHFGELNKLLKQTLVVMYQDAHYAGTGILGTLFKDEGENDKKDVDEQGHTSVLEPSLSITSTFAYAKKSGGERKRVDLALFFALFMMSEARSAHATGYMLVDEAFDSLDAVGQASVLKWCRWMTERLAYVFVVTHSQSLVGIAEKEGGTEGGVDTNIITVKAGDKGTELVANGVNIRSSTTETQA